MATAQHVARRADEYVMTNMKRLAAALTTIILTVALVEVPAHAGTTWAWLHWK